MTRLTELMTKIMEPDAAKRPIHNSPSYLWSETRVVFELDVVLPASFGLRRRLHWVGETTCTANTCIRENWRRELQQRVSVPLWQILCGKFYLIEGKSKP